MNSVVVMDSPAIARYGLAGNRRMAAALRRLADDVDCADEISRVWIKGDLARVGGFSCDIRVAGAARCVEGHIKLAVAGDADMVDEWRASAALVIRSPEGLEPRLALLRRGEDLDGTLALGRALCEQGEVRAACMDARGASDEERMRSEAARERLYWPLMRIVNGINDCEWMNAVRLTDWLRSAADYLDECAAAR